MKKINPNELKKIALDMIYRAKSGHIGSSFSLANIVAALYEHKPSLADKDSQDSLILSKGHGVPIIYAALNVMGVLSDDELLTFRSIGSRLEGHPVHRKIPELSATTGSLGQGASASVGIALGKKLRSLKDSMTYCIIGDGELQEGQVWEAAITACDLKLNNLVWILDNNGNQNDGKVVGDTNSKIDALGALGFTLDRFVINDVEFIKESLEEVTLRQSEIPTLINVKTKKNDGIEELGDLNWHGAIPDKETYAKMLELLGCKNENS